MWGRRRIRCDGEKGDKEKVRTRPRGRELTIKKSSTVCCSLRRPTGRYKKDEPGDRLRVAALKVRSAPRGIRGDERRGVDRQNKDSGERMLKDELMYATDCGHLYVCNEAGKQIEKRRNDMPRKFRKGYDEAMAGKSRQASIKAFCYECFGWETPPSECVSPNCTLFQWRPMKMPGGERKPLSEEAKAQKRLRFMQIRQSGKGQTATIGQSVGVDSVGNEIVEQGDD